MHDVDHPGNNNNYEVQRNSTLALRYNDISVLENHHGAVGWNVIYGGNGEGNGEGSDGNSIGGTIVDSLSKEDLLTFRKTTIKAILHTDMIHHFSLIEQLSSLNTNDAFDIKNPSDRITLVGTLVHAADISNPLIPNFEVVAKWVRTLYVVLVCVDRTDVFFTHLRVVCLFSRSQQADRISHEFLNQYQNELKYNLNPTNMWASLNTNFKVGMYDSQVKFITFIVQPMWSVLVDIFPEFNSEGDLMGSLKTNKKKWSSMLDKEKAKVKREQEEGRGEEKGV